MNASEKVNILRIGGFSFYYFILCSLHWIVRSERTQTFFMKYEIKKKNVFFTIHNLKIGDRIKRRDTII